MVRMLGRFRPAPPGAHERTAGAGAAPTAVRGLFEESGGYVRDLNPAPDVPFADDELALSVLREHLRRYQDSAGSGSV